MASDPHNLQRFTDAQTPVWDDVKAELAAGSKQTHWMWFVFPQLASLGRSSTARFYGIAGAEEARAYLAHPALGARLLECCELLMRVHDRSAIEIFGAVDAMKLRSCLTLFGAAAADPPPVFDACLARYFQGQRDASTLDLLQRA
ncbi:MAG TPA: DUF1810 domain-containing protein [Ramlibacter sp.]|jgi:uncharacterized protein (DUF1810 family)